MSPIDRLIDVQSVHIFRRYAMIVAADFGDKVALLSLSGSDQAMLTPQALSRIEGGTSPAPKSQCARQAFRTP